MAFDHNGKIDDLALMKKCGLEPDDLMLSNERKTRINSIIEKIKDIAILEKKLETNDRGLGSDNPFHDFDYVANDLHPEGKSPATSSATLPATLPPGNTAKAPTIARALSDGTSSPVQVSEGDIEGAQKRPDGPTPG